MKNIISNEDRKRVLIDTAFAYWRASGFPYPELAPHDLWLGYYALEDKQLKISSPQMVLFDALKVTELEIDSTGINVANHFHPHIWESQAYKMKSPMQAYSNDKDLKKAIKLAIEMNFSLKPNSVLNMLRKVNGTQVCSNFRPAVAKTIYQRYYRGKGAVLDPSMGYGGRLLGFIASGIPAQYVGVDPSKKTCDGNERLSSFFGGNTKLINAPFEDVDLSQYPRFSFAFTSPPYFTKELYSDEETQSYKRYPEYHNWLKYFWEATIAKVYSVLERGSYFVINIQDVTIGSRRYPLVADTIGLAEYHGYTLVERLSMRFSSFGKNLKKVKAESVLVFRR